MLQLCGKNYVRGAGEAPAVSRSRGPLLQWVAAINPGRLAENPRVCVRHNDSWGDSRKE